MHREFELFFQTSANELNINSRNMKCRLRQSSLALKEINITSEQNDGSNSSPDRPDDYGRLASTEVSRPDSQGHFQRKVAHLIPHPLHQQVSSPQWITIVLMVWKYYDINIMFSYVVKLYSSKIKPWEQWYLD